MARRAEVLARGDSCAGYLELVLQVKGCLYGF